MSIKPVINIEGSQAAFVGSSCNQLNVDLGAEQPTSTEGSQEVVQLPQNAESAHVEGVFVRSLPINIPERKNNLPFQFVATDKLTTVFEKAAELNHPRKFPVTRRASKEEESLNADQLSKSPTSRTLASDFQLPALINPNKSQDFTIAEMKYKDPPFLYNKTLNLPFLRRTGAYSYLDLNMSMCGCLDTVEVHLTACERRFPPVSSDAAEFVRRNSALLALQLIRLSDEVSPLYSIFERLVLTYEKMQNNQECMWATSSDEELAYIIQCLEQHLKTVRNSKEEFQSLGLLCAKIQKQVKEDNIEAFSCPDLNGHVRLSIRPDFLEDFSVAQDCLVVRDFYLFYMDQFLASHEIYFSKFITVAHQLRLAVKTVM